MVRDLGLAVSGLLNPEMGGPSVQPPLPASLLDRPEFKSERLMAPSRGADRYRRGVYVNVQRTFAVPDAQGLRRGRPERRLPAARAVQHAAPGADAAERPGLRGVSPGRSGSAWCASAGAGTTSESATPSGSLSRGPRTGRRSEILAGVYEDHRALYASDPDATAALLGGEPLPPGVSPPEAAAWIAVARTLLNLDEFITRE